MMSTPRLARVAAKVLDKADVPPANDEARDATVDAIREALKARARSNRHRRWMFGGLALVAAAAAVALVVHRPAETVAVNAPVVEPKEVPTIPPSIDPPPAEPAAKVERLEGTVSVEDGDHLTPLAEGAVVPLGRRIVSAEGSAAVALPSGTRLALARASDVRVDVRESAQVVELGKGAVTFTVAKVPDGERFLVHAGDVEVEVRGTVFRVDRGSDPECGSTTKVELLEGRVVVRAPGGGEKMLVPGDRWTSCAHTPAKTQGPTPKVAASSDLGEANTTFKYALDAEHAGDTPLAVTLFERVMTKYPNGPMYEDAAAHRMKLLEKTDHARASEAAENYIKRFPSGYARRDAARILERSF